MMTKRLLDGGDSATAEGAKNRLLENETKWLRMAIISNDGDDDE